MEKNENVAKFDLNFFSFTTIYYRPLVDKIMLLSVYTFVSSNYLRIISELTSSNDHFINFSRHLLTTYYF